MACEALSWSAGYAVYMLEEVCWNKARKEACWAK